MTANSDYQPILHDFLPEKYKSIDFYFAQSNFGNAQKLNRTLTEHTIENVDTFKNDLMALYRDIRDIIYEEILKEKRKRIDRIPYLKQRIDLTGMSKVDEADVQIITSLKILKANNEVDIEALHGAIHLLVTISNHNAEWVYTEVVPRVQNK